MTQTDAQVGQVVQQICLHPLEVPRDDVRFRRLCGVLPGLVLLQRVRTTNSVKKSSMKMTALIDARISKSRERPFIICVELSRPPRPFTPLPFGAVLALVPEAIDVSPEFEATCRG